MTAIVIAGEVVPVNIDVAEDINTGMKRADFVLNLEKVGYIVERAHLLGHCYGVGRGVGGA